MRLSRSEQVNFEYKIAGPIGLAKNILKGDDVGELFVFNADISCTYPLKDMLSFHRTHGKEGTIMVTQVSDPSKYGVIVYDTNNKIQRFVEKPNVFISDKINAGLYILNQKFLDRVEAKPTSIERDIFPVMAEEGELYAMNLPGFWMDIGQPKDYLTGTMLYFNHLSKNNPEMLEAEANNIKGSVLKVFNIIKNLG